MRRPACSRAVRPGASDDRPTRHPYSAEEVPGGLPRRYEETAGPAIQPLCIHAPVASFTFVSSSRCSVTLRIFTYRALPPVAAPDRTSAPSRLRPAAPSCDISSALAGCIPHVFTLIFSFVVVLGPCHVSLLPGAAAPLAAPGPNPFRLTEPRAPIRRAALSGLMTVKTEGI